MIPLALDELASVVSGTLHHVPEPHQVMASGVAIDSRKVTAGDIFLALVGENTDGHEYAEMALQAGAVVVIGTREVAGPCLVVADPVRALGQIAHHHHRQLTNLTTFGITGSSGKTTTKDLLAQVLAQAGTVVAPQGSFNNELGMPLTVLTATEDTDFLVLEMGARGIGHIAYLCQIAQPNISLVLNVGSAHLGEFGGQQQIAIAKSELVQSLASTGIAVLNADDPLVRQMAEVTKAQVSYFGEALDADVQVTEITLDNQARASFVLNHQGQRQPVTLQIAGEHQVANAAAVATAAIAAGMPLAAVAQALSQAHIQSQWRMEITETAKGVTIINDAYNANPESMRAALKALVAYGDRSQRTWAVLGEMRELGEESLELHDAIGRLAVRLDVNRLIAVGDGARAIHMGAAHEGSWGNESAWVPSVTAAIDILTAELQPGDVVLVKASRAAGLERVAIALAEPNVEAQP